MTQAKPITKVRRGRVFPEIQWSPEKKAKSRLEQEAFYQRCKPIFERVKSELMETCYNWYLTVEPETGDYFLAEDELTAINMSRQKHPNAPFYLFRINETGVSGSI